MPTRRGERRSGPVPRPDIEPARVATHPPRPATPGGGPQGRPAEVRGGLTRGAERDRRRTDSEAQEVEGRPARLGQRTGQGLRQARPA